jgi:hypothetical protein
MQITTTIMLGPEEFAGNLAGNATEIAAAILAAVGGDAEKDICSVNIQDSGMAGALPTLSPPIEEAQPK